MGDLLFFYNVCKNNNFPQSSEFPESCFNFVQDTVFVNHWSTVSVPSFQYRIISCPCMPGYDRNCNNNGCYPSVFYTMLFDPLQMYRPYHNFGGHVDGWQAHAKLKCLFGNPM